MDKEELLSLLRETHTTMLELADGGYSDFTPDQIAALGLAIEIVENEVEDE